MKIEKSKEATTTFRELKCGEVFVIPELASDGYAMKIDALDAANFVWLEGGKMGLIDGNRIVIHYPDATLTPGAAKAGE